MSMEDMEEELESLRDQLEYANRELETIAEEKDKVISALEFKVTTTKSQVEAEFRGRMKAADREAKTQMAGLSRELERLRAAFSGDQGGWEEIEKRNGDIAYRHAETGEERDTEPEALYIAKAMQRVELADTLEKELTELKQKYKARDMKAKEFELSISKLKTEMNSLKTMEKGWKDSAKAIHTSMTTVTSIFDAQYGQIMAGFIGQARQQHHMKYNIPKINKLTEYIKKMQAQISTQQAEIRDLTGKNRTLTAHLEDKTKKVEKLSAGIEDEIERLVKPMRERMADCMTQVMKAKMGRAQERRELADLWPEGHFLPSILMKSRTLNEKERASRVEKCRRQQAAIAAGVEIRKNMAEVKLWETEFDDYGREFYRHKKTGQIIMKLDENGNEQTPEAMSYRPPDGFNEMGNMITSKNEAAQWSMQCKFNGEVVYKHNATGELSYIPPEAYPSVPPGKPIKQVVGEAAHVVLSFIRGKIAANIARLNPIEDPNQKKKKKSEEELEEEKRLAAIESEELSKYVYDIQTVELMSTFCEEGEKQMREKEKQDSKEAEENKEKKLHDDIVAEYIGPSLHDINIEETTVDAVRDLLADYSKLESLLEGRLGRIHLNMRDFSYLLMEKIKQKREQDALDDQERQEQAKKDRKEAREKKRAERREKKRQDRIARGEDPDQDSLGDDDEEDEWTGSLASTVEIDAVSNLDGAESANGSKRSKRSKVHPKDGTKPSDAQIREEIEVENRLNPDPEPPAKGDADPETDHPKPDGSGSKAKEDEETEEDDDNGEEEDDVAEAEDVEHGSKVTGPVVDDDNVSRLTGAEVEDGEQTEMYKMAANKEQIEDPSVYLPVIGDPSLGISESLQEEEDEDEDHDSMTVPEKSVEEVTEICLKMAMYCGFTNLRIDHAPDDVNYEYSFDLEDQNKTSDDKWLTASYFISCTKERVDAVREQITREYDPVLGSLNVEPLRSLRLQHDVESESSTQNKWAPVMNAVNEKLANLQSQHALWRGQQLTAEVLRYQIQQEAIRDAYKGREASRDIPPPSNGSYMSLVPFGAHQISAVDVHVKHVATMNIPRDEYSFEELQFIRLSFGTWSVRMTSTHPKRHGMIWEDLNVKVNLPMKNIHYDELLVEAFEESELQQDILICSGRSSIATTIGQNLARDIEVTVTMKTKSGTYAGEVTLILHTEHSSPLAPKTQDPHIILHQKVPQYTSKTRGEEVVIEAAKKEYYKSNKSVRGAEDDLSGVFPSLVKDQSDFASMVSDLRGDGKGFVQMMVGDVDNKAILRLGHRPSEDYVKPLPSVEAARALMDLKIRIHNDEVNQGCEEVDTYNTTVLNGIQERLKELEKQLKTAKSRHEDMLTRAENSRAECKKVWDRADDVRHPKPKPPEPDFSNVPEIKLVYQIPKTGNLDDKGKKKKALPKDEEKQLVKNIAAGGCDGIDWNFGLFFPSGGQTKKMKKAIDARNVVVLELREKERLRQDEEIKTWKDNMVVWEEDDKKREASYGKMKKDLRRINLKTDCFGEREDRLKNDIKQLEWDISMWNNILELHTQARDRFTCMRAKVEIERHRQDQSVEHHRGKLFRVLEARRRALELPGGATNHLHFEELRQKAEVALRTLRFEIVQCKSNLVEEGVRLRAVMHEEEVAVKSELMRTRMLVEILRQKTCIEKIVDKHRYEVLHLMEDLEKLKMADADRDDQGKDTIDDLGERFKADKVWTGPGIQECLDVINTIMAKIELTEGMTQTNLNSQKCVLESLSVKWGSEYLTFRDSWIENSDYERSKKVMNDMVMWVNAQRDRLGRKEAELVNYRTELFREVKCLEEQNDISMECQRTETSSMAEATLRAIKVVKDKLEHVTEHSRVQILSLDKSMTEISRESQKLREDIMRDKGMYEEKIQTLLQLIATLQTTLQTLTARVEVLSIEKERVVTKAKLETDSMKQSLKAERRHTINLLFILHSQKGFIYRLQDKLDRFWTENANKDKDFANIRNRLRQEVWEQVFSFTQLCTNVDALFEFFALRMANLAGSRKLINNAMHRNNAAVVFAAMCKSPRPIIRKLAARALSGLGWDGYVETRILMWDSVMQWKLFKANTMAGNNAFYLKSLEQYKDTGDLASILTVSGEIEEFIPAENVSLRTLIKQRRQWAIRKTRRHEGPNLVNQRLLNMHDGIIPTLLLLCRDDGRIDWEIVRNAAMALSIASFDPQNHYDMSNDDMCVGMLSHLCKNDDIEIVTHAAITIANLCHKDEKAQLTFGAAGCIEALLDICQYNVVDALEAATAALSNMTCLCDANCRRVMECGGVIQLVALVTLPYSENLLNLDQNEEVQANAAEILANVSRYNCELTVKYFNIEVVDSLVIMCASDNNLVKRHTPLVLGNIAQNEDCRVTVGNRGGIEAIFLVLEDEDNAIQANALWALCNLMWYPSNQERAGRFMSEVISFLSASWLPIKTHACILLANLVYYNNNNRVRFLESDGSIEIVINYVRQKEDKSIVEANLRTLLSLSYLDQVAMWLGTDGDIIPLLISLLQVPLVSRDVMRYSLEIICNLCIHHVNRKKILDNAGIEALVSLHTDVDAHIRETSVSVIEHLEDVTPAEVLARAKQDIGVERMVQLASNHDPLVRAVAAETIGEEVWRNPKQQSKATVAGGVEALLGIISNKAEAVESLLPSLWSLRNVLHNSDSAKHIFEDNNGVQIIVSALSRTLTGTFIEQTEKVLEGCLILLATAIMANDRNARKLLVLGLELVMDLAEQKMGRSVGADPHLRIALNSESVIALAKSILQILGPYNYVVCRNCQKKQELSGTHCFNCGAALLVDVSHKMVKGNGIGALMSATSASNAGPSVHRKAIDRAMGKTV